MGSIVGSKKKTNFLGLNLGSPKKTNPKDQFWSNKDQFQKTNFGLTILKGQFQKTNSGLTILKAQFQKPNAWAPHLKAQLQKPNFGLGPQKAELRGPILGDTCLGGPIQASSCLPLSAGSQPAVCPKYRNPGIFADWLAGWLAGWLVGLAGWLAGW